MFIFILLSALITPSFSSPPLDYKCENYQGLYDGVVITKKNDNEIHIDAKVDVDTCEFIDEHPLRIYWKVGERKKNGIVPCQEFSKLERKMTGLRESNSKIISATQASLVYGMLKKEGSKKDHDISKYILFDLNMSKSGKCIMTSTIDIDNIPLVFDSLHIELSGKFIKRFKKALFFLDNKEVFRF